MAVGQVLLRKLKNLSNMTVSCYTNLTSIPVFLIWALCAGDDLKAYQNFNTLDWITMVSVSVLLVFAQTLYFVAYANLPAPAL